MAERFTIELPEERVNTFREIARLANESIESVIAELACINLLEATYLPQVEKIKSFSTIHLWSMVQRGLDFPSDSDKRMIELLQKSKAEDEHITKLEWLELENLNYLYNIYNELRANVLAELKNRDEDIESISS